MIISNVGRLPGSSFMQIFINLVKYGDVPGGICTRKPSVAIRIPHSIGDRSANGTSPKQHKRETKLR